MPIYEYFCEEHGRFELIRTLAEYIELGQCEDCFDWCPKIWSIPATVQIAKPSPIFINKKTGETRTAISEHEKAPDGFVREELKGPIERSRFEKEQNAKERERNEKIINARQLDIDLARRARRMDNESRLNSLAEKTDNPEGTKELAKAARRFKDKKRKVPKPDTAFRFVVNHSDSSNINKG